MSRRLIALGAALPLLVLVLSIADAEMNLAGGETFRLPIEGYDPRDLLRGRYLRYRVKEPTAAPLDTCEGEDCCLCLSHGAAPRSATCPTARIRCDAALPRRRVEELERYYIPEAHAPTLERRFMDAAAEGRAHIVVTVDAREHPHVRHLELRGERIK